MTPVHPDRQRDYEAPHIRPIDIQILDALVRIEELLQKLVDHEDRRQPVVTAPTTLASTKLEAKPAKKNPRSL